MNKIVVHVGCNDIPSEQSEVTKADYIHLIDQLNNTGKSILISGLIPTLGRGMGRFTRTLSLHSWLVSYCSAHKIVFIDNFNLFWNHSPFYLRDGIHPSSLGSSMLSDNIQHAVTLLPASRSSYTRESS